METVPFATPKDTNTFESNHPIYASEGPSASAAHEAESSQARRIPVSLHPIREPARIYQCQITAVDFPDSQKTVMSETDCSVTIDSDRARSPYSETIGAGDFILNIDRA